MTLKTLDRYMLRELVPGFVVSVTVFTFIVAVDRLYQLTDLVIAKGASVRQVGWLLALMLPSLLTITLPLSFLVAMALACARLTADSETVALAGAGIGPLRLLKPVVLVAAALAVVVGFVTNVVDPWAYRAMRYQVAAVLKSRAEGGIQERSFNSLFARVVVYAEELDPRQRSLKALLVSDERRPGHPRIFVAREATFLEGDGDRVTLRLRNGAVSDANPDTPARSRVVSFDQCDITVTADSPEAVIDGLKTRPRDLPLLRLIRRVQDDGDVHSAYEMRRRLAALRPVWVEVHKRLALPLVPVVFALAGYPVALLASRRGRGAAVGGVLAIAFAYYVSFTAMEGAALAGHVSPAAVWLPDAVFAALGAGMLALLCSAHDGRRAIETGVRAATARLTRLGSRWWPRPRRARSRPARRHRRVPLFMTMDRYLAREYVTRIAGALAGIAVLLFIVELVQSLDDLLAARPGVAYLVEYFALRVTSGVYETLPVAVLIATVFLFASLTRHRELDAFKAAGVSLQRVSLPVVVVAVTMTGAALLFQETVLPALKDRTEALDRVIERRERGGLAQRSDAWYRVGETRFLRIEPPAKPGPARPPRGIVQLEVEPGFALIRQLRYDGTGAPIVHATAGSASRLPETMSFRELRRYIDGLQARGRSVRGLLVAFYARLAFPFVCIAFAILVIPLAANGHLGHRAAGVVIVVVILIGYWLVHAIALSAGRADLLPPLVAAWTSNLAFTGIGTAAFLRART